MQSVKLDFFDYSLTRSSVIETYKLSKENYGDSIFIHPPFFVYVCVLIQSIWPYGNISLSFISVIFHVFTSLFMMGIIETLSIHHMNMNDNNSDIDGHNNNDYNSNSSNSNKDNSNSSNVNQLGDLISTAVITKKSFPVEGGGSYLAPSYLHHIAWMTLIFYFCPITTLCSQKIWIDNALMLTCTFSVYIHILLTKNYYKYVNTLCHDEQYKNSKSSKSFYLFIVHILSGLCFGGIALNCKITAIMLLPFMYIWSVIEMTINQISNGHPTLLHLTSKISSGGWNGSIVVSIEIVLHMIKSTMPHICYFTLGAVLGHSPWLILYEVLQYDVIHIHE